MSRPLILHISAVEYTLRRLVLPQLEVLGDRGFDVRVACAPEGDDFDGSLAPFQPQPLRFPRALSPSGFARAARDLTRLVNRLEPALVHFHTPAASIPGRAVLAVPGGGRPKVVQTVHGFFSPGDQRAVGMAVAATERLLSRATDLSLFVSAEDLQLARRHRHRGLLMYVGNGVGDDWFVGDRREPERTGRLRAIFVGRLVREKGLLDLLQAMTMTDRVELTIVGDELPSDRDGVSRQARRQAEPLGDRVTFTSMIDPDKVRAHLLDSHVLVLPSEREGLPMSVIEAMACGLPVIATAIRGCRELVVPGMNGWLVPPGSPAALAEALDAAAASSPEELRALGRAGFDRAQGYRLSHTVDRVVDAYGRLGVMPGD